LCYEIVFLGGVKEETLGGAKHFKKFRHEFRTKSPKRKGVGGIKMDCFAGQKGKKKGLGRGPPVQGGEFTERRTLLEGPCGGRLLAFKDEPEEERMWPKSGTGVATGRGGVQKDLSEACLGRIKGNEGGRKKGSDAGGGKPLRLGSGTNLT